MQATVPTEDPVVKHMGDEIQDDVDYEKADDTANNVMVFGSEFAIDYRISTAEQVEDENDLTTKSEKETVSSQVNDVNEMTENKKPPCESETDANEHENKDKIVPSPEDNEYEGKDLGNMKVEVVNENNERISESDHQLNMVITEQIKEEKIEQTAHTEAQQFNENVDITKEDGTNDNISDSLYASEIEMQMTSVRLKVEHELTTAGEGKATVCPIHDVLMVTVEKQANESETDAHKQNDEHKYISEREVNETTIEERETKNIEGLDAIQNVSFSDTERLSRTHNDPQTKADTKLIDESEMVAYEQDSDSGSISNSLAQGKEVKQLENTKYEYTDDQDRISEETIKKVKLLTDEREENMQQTPDTEAELNTRPMIKEMNDGVGKKNVEDTDEKVIDNISESKLDMQTTTLEEIKEHDYFVSKNEDGAVTGKTHDITEITTEDEKVPYALKPDFSEADSTVKVLSEEADKSEIVYLENDKVEGSVDKKNEITLEKDFTIDTALEDKIKEEFMQTTVSTADPAVQHMGDVIQDDYEKAEGTANGVMVFNSEFEIDKQISTTEQIEDENDLTTKSETTTVSSQVNDVNEMTENNKPPCESETDANEHSNQDQIISSPENNEYECKHLGNMKVEGINENNERISEIDHQLNMIINEQLKEEKIDQTADTEAQQFNENVDITKDDGTSDKISDGLYASESEMEMTSVGEKDEHELTTKGDVEAATCPTNDFLMVTVEKQANESETDAQKQNDKQEYITEREAGETKIEERETKNIEKLDAIQNVSFFYTKGPSQTHNDPKTIEDKKMIDESEIGVYEHDSDSGSISNSLAQGTEGKQLENTNDEYTDDQDRILEEKSQKVKVLTDALEEDMQQTPDTESELNTRHMIQEMNDGVEKKNVEDSDEKVIDNIPEFKSDMRTTALVEMKELNDHFLKSEDGTVNGKTHDITEMTTEDKIVSYTLKPDLNEEEHTVEVLSEEADKSEIGYLENDKVEGSVDKKNEITLEKDFTIDTASEDKIKDEFMQTIVPTPDPAVKHMGDVIQDDVDNEKSEGTANGVMVFNSEFEIGKQISTAEQVEDENDLTIKSETTTVSSQVNDVNEITEKKKPSCESETAANEHSNQDRIISSPENYEYEDKDVGNMKVEVVNENNEMISEIDHQLNMIITEQLKEEKIDQTADKEAQQFNENVDITKDDGISDKISDGLYASESEMQMTSVGEKVEHEITTKGDVEAATCPTNDVLMVTVEKQAKESETDAHKQNDKHEYITEREAGETKIDEREAKTIEDVDAIQNVIFSDTERLNQTHNDSQATEDQKLIDECEIMEYEHDSDSRSILYSLAQGTDIKQLENTNDEYTHDQDRILEEESQKVNMLTDKLEEDMQQTPDTESELNTIHKIEEMNDSVEKKNVEDTDEKVIDNIPESKSDMQTTTLVEIKEHDDHFLKLEEWTLTGKTHDITEMTTEDEIVSYTLKPDLIEEEHTVKVLSKETDKSDIGYLENDKVEGSVDKKNKITLEKDFTIDTAFEDKIKNEFMQTTVPTADPAVQHMGDVIQDDVDYEKAEGTANDVMVFNSEFEIDKHILTAEQIEDENDLTIKRERTTVRSQVNDVNEMTENRKPPCEYETDANEHNNQDRIISSTEKNEYENKDLGNMKVEGVNENNERISEIDHQLNMIITEQLKEEKIDQTADTEAQQFNENVDITKDDGTSDKTSDGLYASESKMQMISVGEKVEHEITTKGDVEAATCPTKDVLMVTVEKQANESETDAHKQNDKHEYITEREAGETKIDEREAKPIEGIDAIQNVIFSDTERLNQTHNDSQATEDQKPIDEFEIMAYEHDSDSGSISNSLAQGTEIKQLENTNDEYTHDQDRILEEESQKVDMLTDKLEEEMQQTPDTESELNTIPKIEEMNDGMEKKNIEDTDEEVIDNIPESKSDMQTTKLVEIKEHGDHFFKSEEWTLTGKTLDITEMTTEDKIVSYTLKPDLNEEEHTVEVLSEEADKSEIGYLENDKVEGSVDKKNEITLEKDFTIDTASEDKIKNELMQTIVPTADPAVQHMGDIIQDDLDNEKSEGTANGVMVFNSEFEIDKHISTAEQVEDKNDLTIKSETTTVSSQVNDVNEMTENKKPPCESETAANEHNNQDQIISSPENNEYEDKELGNMKVEGVNENNERISEIDHQLNMIITEQIKETADTEAQQFNENVDITKDDGTSDKISDGLYASESEMQMTSVGEKDEHELTTKGDVEVATCPTNDVLMVTVEKQANESETDAHKQNDKHEYITEREAGETKIDEREAKTFEGVDAIQNIIFSDTERLNQTQNDSQATEDQKLIDECEIMAYEHDSDSRSIPNSLAQGTEIKQLENTNDEYTHDQDRILEEESQKVNMLTDKLEEDMQQTPDTESELNKIPKIEEMNDGVEKKNVEDTDEKVIRQYS
ncbi:hypothetical protein DPMN_194559 [Dreissena polymorpha]|uniref:Uncharacterized protein n=1 Tax=Dreissena polymorpha TaxID=45954 RepID=A0A9D3Y557_DREPO|nr:hypothetical protein DPMN_194559 [Dreissena polymorpha]